VIVDLVVEDDLDVPVRVEVMQGDGPRLALKLTGRATVGGVGPLHRAVVLERLDAEHAAVDVHGDQLGQPIVVDVAERRRARARHALGRRDREVLEPRLAIDHVDVAGGVVADEVVGDENDVGRIAEIDLAVGVVVREVADQGRHPTGLPFAERPLRVRGEAVGGRLVLAVADRIHVVGHLADVDRRQLGIGRRLEVELDPRVAVRRVVVVVVTAGDRAIVVVVVVVVAAGADRIVADRDAERLAAAIVVLR